MMLRVQGSELLMYVRKVLEITQCSVYVIMDGFIGVGRV